MLEARDSNYIPLRLDENEKDISIRIGNGNMRMHKGLAIFLRPILGQEIRDVQNRKINLIPYIGNLLRNCINECKSNK
jgi:hypothetical protein